MPPSAVAAADISEASFCAQFKEMWANKNFILLSIAYAIVYGVYCSIGSTMSNLMNPFGYSVSDISVAGGASLLAGVAGAIIIGILLDYTAWYGWTHKTLTFAVLASIVSTFAVLGLLDEPNMSLILPCTVLLGVASVSFFPASLSYGAELTFPLQPALVNACMNFMG